MSRSPLYVFFFFNDTATTEIYTLSLHDALPISHHPHLHAHLNGLAELLLVLDVRGGERVDLLEHPRHRREERRVQDRKSTRLNSSHANISYAVFCLKKKKLSDVQIIT